MNGYELRQKDDGSIEIVEIVPSVIATFADRAHAERYFDFLTGPKDPVPPRPTALPAPVETAPAARTAKATQTFSDPTGEEWEKAFTYLMAGEDMKAVAARMSVDMYKLRGKYAAWRRRQNERAAAEAPTGNPAALETSDCRMCGRTFRDTAESDGLCARCFHG
ncbi:hypothetical protein [Chachezhania antarctica]|uniref:hypothetical protein n=1 Tax=Chachezhania antarctica TaxID=2340860 RepID=UPI000EB27A60|nr:hypothetical protein [Chachezhania antarctica]|tara:strand:- start:8963 stop:9454 length:492 start_codon:yes stop_codon:yes gene_type:complete